MNKTKVFLLALASVVWGDLLAQPANNNSTTQSAPALNCAPNAPILLVPDWNQSATFVGCKDSGGKYQLTPFAYTRNVSFVSFYSLPQYRILWGLGNSGRFVKFDLDGNGLPAQVGYHLWTFPIGDVIVSADWSRVDVFSTGNSNPQSYTVTTDRHIVYGEMSDQPNYIPSGCAHPVNILHGDFFCVDTGQGGIWKAPASLGSNGPLFNQGSYVEDAKSLVNPVALAADGNRLFVLLANEYDYATPTPQQAPLKSYGRLVRIDFSPQGDYLGKTDVVPVVNIGTGINQVLARNGQVFFMRETPDGREVVVYDDTSGRLEVAFPAKQINPNSAFVGTLGFLN